MTSKVSVQQAPSMHAPCVLCVGEVVPPGTPRGPPDTDVGTLLPVYRSICMDQSQSLECCLILLVLVDGVRLFYLNLDKFFIRKYFW